MNRTLIVSVFAVSFYRGVFANTICRDASTSDQGSLRATGRGMGLTLAAQLNGHPSRVIELTDKPELTADQRGSVKALFDSMKAAIFRRVADQHGCHGEWAEGS